MFLPFSANAKKWEPQAIALRRLAGVDGDSLLNPIVLAPKVGLAVLDWDCACVELNTEERNHLLAAGWSGGVMAKPLPNGLRICIINPDHSRCRNKITLMEEICHIFLKHVPSEIQRQSDGLASRTYNKAQEVEAYGTGAAALLPWATFYHGLNAGRSALELAEQYDVTRDLIEYRIKITGASKLYLSRQRRATAP